MLLINQEATDVLDTIGVLRSDPLLYVLVVVLLVWIFLRERRISDLEKQKDDIIKELSALIASIGPAISNLDKRFTESFGRLESMVKENKDEVIKHFNFLKGIGKTED